MGTKTFKESRRFRNSSFSSGVDRSEHGGTCTYIGVHGHVASVLESWWWRGLIGQIIEPCNFRYLNGVEKLFRYKQSVKFTNFNFSLYKFNSGFRKMVMSMLFTIWLLLKCFRTITFLHSEVDNYFVGIFHT